MLSGEFEFIEWVRARAKVHPRVPLGIGDDAAVLRFSVPADCLVAVDTLMEGVHFTWPEMSAAQIGRKALAVNLSDIAAMAGKPLAAVVGAVFNRNHGAPFARELEGGLLALAEEFDVALIGGDTNTWDGPCVVSVTVLGEATGHGAVRRIGAKVGDWILATGSFGGSLLRKHHEFQPRVKEALALHEAVNLHAMMDVSDGLAADLYHILDESQVGAVLYAERIPISDDARNAKDDRSPLEHALGDGEDFELLFTVSVADGERLLKQNPISTRLSKLGEIVESGRYELIDQNNKTQPLPRTGWVHEF
jgi:thiamine-monophosphate kinase